jgi:hypothetical protein
MDALPEKVHFGWQNSFLGLLTTATVQLNDI